MALIHRLEEEGFSTWFDEKDLYGGDNWRQVIKREIKDSDFFALFLSKSAINKEGFFHEEIRTAIEEYRLRPHGSVFLLPVLLDPCIVPEIELDSTTDLTKIQ